MSTTGAKAPTVAASVAESPWLDNAWVSPENIYGAGYASVTAATFDAGDQTEVLKAYTFDFSAIPDNATITGAKVIINAKYATAAVSIDLLQLLDISRAKGGTNKCSTPQALTTSDANYTFGADGDLWGNALTPSWVKDPDFGVAIGCLAGGSGNSNNDVYVDSVTMEIFYTVPAAYTLPAAAGSFSETGTSAGMKTTRLLAATATSYSMTGTAVALRKGYPLNAEAGSFAMTGTTAGLRATRTLPATPGSFVMTGTAAGLLAARKLAAVVSVFNMTGADVMPLKASKVSPAAGSFAVSGADAALVRASKVIAEAGGFSLVGPDVGLVYVPAGGTGYSMAAEQGVFNLAGDDALMLVDRRLASGGAEFILIGKAIAFHCGKTTDVWVALPPIKHSIPGTPTHPRRWKFGEKKWWP